MANHQVELSIPTDPAFVRIVRLTASGVAALIPFDVDRIDDLRITVDEICSTMIEVGRDVVRIVFTVDDTSITVDAASALGSPDDLDEQRFDFTRQIIDVLADSHEFSRSDHEATFRATLAVGMEEAAGAR